MDYRGPTSGRRLQEHTRKLLAKVAGVQIGRRMDLGIIKKGEGRRLGDRMTAVGTKGRSQGSGSGLEF